MAFTLNTEENTIPGEAKTRFIELYTVRINEFRRNRLMSYVEGSEKLRVKAVPNAVTGTGDNHLTEAAFVRAHFSTRCGALGNGPVYS